MARLSNEAIIEVVFGLCVAVPALIVGCLAYWLPRRNEGQDSGRAPGLLKLTKFVLTRALANAPRIIDDDMEQRFLVLIEVQIASRSRPVWTGRGTAFSSAQDPVPPSAETRSGSKWGRMVSLDRRRPRVEYG